MKITKITESLKIMLAALNNNGKLSMLRDDEGFFYLRRTALPNDIRMYVSDEGGKEFLVLMIDQECDHLPDALTAWYPNTDDQVVRLIRKFADGAI